MEKTVYLGSTSQSRQMLLREAGIPFTLISQLADETKCDWNLPLSEVVKNIAVYKMQHTIIPAGSEGDICYVLTGDTLTSDEHGAIHGKPVDREDAKRKLRAVRGMQVVTGTAFCLERKKYCDNVWATDGHIVRYAKGAYRFDVPEQWLDRYLDHSVGMCGAGAIGIESYGNLFLKEVSGSYSAIIGMPLFELREALEELGFFE